MSPSKANTDTDISVTHCTTIKLLEDKLEQREKELAGYQEELQEYMEPGQEDKLERKTLERKIHYHNVFIRTLKTQLKMRRELEKKITENREMREASNKRLETLQTQIEQPERKSTNENKPEKETMPTQENRGISMHVFSLFMTTIGCAAIATAFIFLNAASFGTAGLIVAGIGVACTLAGIGMFTRRQLINDDILDDSVSYSH
jgi:predicted phage tail protein